MPDLSIEKQYSGHIICGIDEVGRGPLAGPVMAAAVILPDNVLDIPELALLNDSKKLTAKRREALFPAIQTHCQFGIGQASVKEIDQINILQASLLAMARAYEALPTQATVALIDGNKTPNLSCTMQTVVKGDNVSLSIAAASIIAKVTRDRLMEELGKEYLAYGWSGNAGYGTKTHMEALQTHGATIHHRTSFAPVARAIKAI